MELFLYLMIVLYWRKFMRNRYRLSSNAFERETEEDKVAPQKIFYLSVEGNATEKEYFDGFSLYNFPKQTYNISKCEKSS